VSVKSRDDEHQVRQDKGKAKATQKGGKGKHTDMSTPDISSVEGDHWSADDSSSESTVEEIPRPQGYTDNSAYWQQRQENIKRNTLLTESLKASFTELANLADLNPASGAVKPGKQPRKRKSTTAERQVCGMVSTMSLCTNCEDMQQSTNPPTADGGSNATEDKDETTLPNSDEASASNLDAELQDDMHGERVPS
jgi:hypothetical protein